MYLPLAPAGRLRVVKILISSLFVVSGAAFAAAPISPFEALLRADVPDICQIVPELEIAPLLAAAQTAVPRETGWELAAVQPAATEDGANEQKVAAAPPAKKEFFGGAFEFMAKIPSGIAKIPSNIALNTSLLADHISAKFKVDPDVSQRVVAAAVDRGAAAKISPTLILAVIAVESRFDAEAQNGNATGLMQIIPFWHKDKVAAIGGPSKLATIENNIATGSKILREYLDRSGGNLLKAVYHYNGSPHASAYAKKVMNEQQKFEKVLKME